MFLVYSRRWLSLYLSRHVGRNVGRNVGCYVDLHLGLGLSVACVRPDWRGAMLCVLLRLPDRLHSHPFWQSGHHYGP